jgi:hypothetical protein
LIGDTRGYQTKRATQVRGGVVVSFFQGKRRQSASWKLALFVGGIAVAGWVLSKPRHRGRAKGIAVRALRGPRTQRLNDAGLADKIRSEVIGAHPNARINVNVEDRVAVLRGQVLTLGDIDDIERGVRGVSGITDVRNYLHLQDEDAPNKADSLELELAPSQTDNTLQHKTLS